VHNSGVPLLLPTGRDYELTDEFVGEGFVCVFEISLYYDDVLMITVPVRKQTSVVAEKGYDSEKVVVLLYDSVRFSCLCAYWL
jgi:hypothetical protein